ncbi:neurofascin-like [Babylonia areolata]|uniref:neurofascin-like n=1 Tax=Babylonia areolata TaxID=304850 RepID=UPI003FD3727F
MGGSCLWTFILAVVISPGPRVTGTIILSSPTDQDLDIPTPPHVTEPTEPALHYVLANGNHSLHCRATGNPAPTLKWKVNGDLVSTMGDPRLLEDQMKGTLVLQAFDVSMEGYYQCLANNKHGVSLSQVVEMRLIVEPKFLNPKKPNNTVRVKEGHGAKLKCTDQPYRQPDGTYSWYHVKGATQEMIQVDQSDRMDIDLNGTLYFIDARPGDTATTYACAISFGESNKVTVAQTPYVALQVTPGAVQEFPPSLLESTGYTTGDIGGQATLECFFSGQPRPRITWIDGRWNEQIVHEAEDRKFITNGGHRLTIKGLRDGDEGRYICEASNSMAKHRGITFLNVTSRPTFRIPSPQILVTPVGSDPTFTCLAQGAFGEAPVSRPTWTINGHNGNSMRYRISEDGTRLTLIDVTKDDMTCVQCNVSNSRGYTFGDGFLAVIDPLEVDNEPNTTVEVEPGTTRSLNLTVTATSDECCPVSFAWSFEGRFLDQKALRTAPYSYDLGHNEAMLTLDLTHDLQGLMGQYRCDVFHSAYAEKFSVVVNVRVKEKEKPVTERMVEARGLNLWWLGVVGGVLVLLIALIAIFLMVRYNYPRQEYLLDKEEKKHRLNPERDIMDHSFEEI